MKKKAIGFMAALSIGGGTLVLRLTDLISNQMLFWAFLVLVMLAASVLFSYLATEEYKRRNFTQEQIDCINTLHSPKCDKEKRMTYNYAVKSGRAAMAMCGVGFVLLEVPDLRYKVVIGVLWIFLILLAGFLSPIAWRIGKEYLRRRKSARPAQ
jgi:hypothetical protein